MEAYIPRQFGRVNMKTIQSDDLLRAKEGFHLRGESVAEWALRHGFSAHTVYQVLSGKSLAVRGDSHRVAVALGLKPDTGAPETDSCAPVEQENAM